VSASIKTVGQRVHCQHLVLTNHIGTVKVRNNWTNPGRSAPYPSVSLVIVTKRFDGRRLEVEFRFLLNGRGAVRKVPAAILSLKTRIANIIRSSPVHT
jgi:hypothetical protein